MHNVYTVNSVHACLAVIAPLRLAGHEGVQRSGVRLAECVVTGQAERG